MLKLYRMRGDVLEYWEAWIKATDVTVHWGRVGEEGEMREQPHEAGLHPSEIVEREAKPLRAAGFKERKVNQLHSVVVQYRINGHGTPSDLDRRVQVEELMNECLGWTGLGHCDGGDIGSGSMNIFCFVVDTTIAERVIVSALDERGILEGAVTAETNESTTKVIWPHDFAGAFSIL